MEEPRSAASRVWRWLALASGVFAYRPLWRDALALPSAYAVEVGLFRPAPLPPLLVLGVACWLLWRRRARLLAAPPRRDWASAALLAAIGAAGFVWACLTQAAGLLFASAAANLLAFGAAARGRAGVRALLFPSLVLLLGLRIPTPLEDELVWQLQRWAAS